MKFAFTEERGDMKTFMEKVADGKMGARHSDPVVAVFKQRLEETFKRHAKGGRTPALWAEDHHMIDMMKIRTERLADQDDSHLCRCSSSSLCQGCMVVLSTHEGIRYFACLQRHITTSHCLREPRCPFLKS